MVSAIPSNFFTFVTASVMPGYTERRKIDNLPVLVSCQSVTSAILSTEFNSPVDVDD